MTRREGEREWLADQLAETQELIDKLRDEPDSPKRQLALDELGRIQVRILQILADDDGPNSN